MAKANDEMVQGFLDGYDLTAPEPSANRSASYRQALKMAGTTAEASLGTAPKT
jgi:3-oxoacyl-(acyl-carrier-protein) synthase